MTEIERYLAQRESQDWDEDDTQPVFDSTDFANDIGTATYRIPTVKERLYG